MSLTNPRTNHEVCGVIFQLIDEFIFPDPSLAEEDGLLAVGGDLHPERLMLAYENGIFPWYSDDTPILWYSPHERFVLFPDKIKLARSMRQFLKKENVEIRMNTNFEAVIRNCETVNRQGQDGTWITEDMRNAYIELHKLGFAHSVETYIDGKLAGGLYGVQTGNVFCGESMFSLQPNASKAALIWSATTQNYDLIDCQVHTPHLENMGAEFITREEYGKILEMSKQ